MELQSSQTQINRKRRKNWTEEEKELLYNLASQSIHIIEKKDNTTDANAHKWEEWKKISNKFNVLTGENRNKFELRLYWQQLKKTIKNKPYGSQPLTGDRPPSPSLEELAIMVMTPYESKTANNKSDSEETRQIAFTDTSDTHQFNIEVMSASSTSSEMTQHSEELANEEQDEENESDDMNEVLDDDSINSESLTLGKKEFTSFKKRQLEIMEEEHALNLEIHHLKIKKLKLEIEILEKQNKNT